jgi:hypothetical protein
MNKQFNMTIDLSPAEIKEAITLYINQNFTSDGMSTTENDVTINVETHHEDRGGMSYPKLTGASVKVKKMGAYQDR